MIIHLATINPLIKRLWLFTISMVVVYLGLGSSLALATDTNDNIKLTDNQVGADIIRQMNQAREVLNYHGKIVQYNNMRRSEYDIKSQSDGVKNILYSIESLTGDRNKIIIKKDEVICYFPKKKMITKDTLSGSMNSAGASNYDHVFDEKVLDTSSLTLSKIEPYYDIVVAMDNTKQQAGRDVYSITLKPKDEFRYRQELLVDKENSLLLSFTLLNHDNEIIRSLYFSEVQFLSKNEADAINMDDWDVYDYRVENQEMPMKSMPLTQDVNDENTQALANKVMSQMIQLGERCSIPTNIHGFHYRNSMVRESSSDDGMQQLNFSDGMSVVSLFMSNYTQNDEELSDGQFQQKDSIYSYSKIAWDKKIVVMGEVPMNLINAFAEQLKCD